MLSAIVEREQEWHRRARWRASLITAAVYNAAGKVFKGWLNPEDVVKEGGREPDGDVEIVEPSELRQIVRGWLAGPVVKKGEEDKQ